MTTDPAPVDRGAFRDAMARWATGVSVVTAHADGADAGLTVNAFLSVALDPPSVLVALTQDVDTLPVLEKSGAFAVCVLAADQRAVSERFARAIPTAEKFRGVGVHRGTTGAPLLDGALATLECRVARVLPVYDHRLVIGEVERLERGPDGAPLLFYRSGYADAGPDGTVRLPPPRSPR
ncbi:MAG TPA: flavin reductase family protein [Thermoplasmata archaeon]|nr:flavin reductase family protein [Thermoplasmata archaeon]